MRSSAGKSSNPYTAVNTTAASTAFGRFSKQAGQKQQAKRKRDRGKNQRQRRACAGLVIHRRLREAAGDRIAVSHRRCEIGRTDAQKFLPGIQRVSMLCSEGAGGGHALDIGQQQATRGQRNDPLDIAQPQRRACQGGQACRNFSCRWHPKRRQPQQRGSAIDSATTPSATGFPGSSRSPNTSSRIAMTPTTRTRYCVWPSCPASSESPFEEIVAPALHAEQARQLCHRDSQAGAGLEPHKNAVADQLYQHAQPQQPSEQAERRHREGREAGDLCIALSVPLRHCSHGPGNHQRDGGSGPDRELARGSQQRVAQTAQ